MAIAVDPVELRPQVVTQSKTIRYQRAIIKE
jgi:hypothetical protein